MRTNRTPDEWVRRGNYHLNYSPFQKKLDEELLKKQEHSAVA